MFSFIHVKDRGKGKLQYVGVLQPVHAGKTGWLERMSFLEKERKRRNKENRRLTRAQEIKYSRAFKVADRAGGFGSHQGKL